MTPSSIEDVKASFIEGYISAKTAISQLKAWGMNDDDIETFIDTFTRDHAIAVSENVLRFPTWYALYNISIDGIVNLFVWGT